MKTLVQYGAGNIGRGFIGQLFSDAGYSVSFVDVNRELIESLNRRKRYPVRVVSNGGIRETWVENVSGINGFDTEAVAAAIAGCDIMATAVGVNILPRIVPNIAAGIRKRISSGNDKPLNILICENLLGADKLLHRLLAEKLGAEYTEVLNSKIGFVETSIGRMVPVMTDEQKKDNPLRICVESYCELPVDKEAFKGDIPFVPHLHPFTPFEFYIERKLFVHNMGHALTAYLGSLAGCETIWQAVENPYIKLFVERAMAESATALSIQYNVPLQDLMENIVDLLLRFGNKALGDTVDRVGRDIKRKLSANDRFAGAVKLCEKAGTSSVYIAVGIAAGLLFDCENDSGTADINEMIGRKGIEAVLDELCGLEDRNRYIRTYYEQLSKNRSMVDLLKTAELFKEEQLGNKCII